MTVPDDATPIPGHRHLNPILELAAGTVVGVAAIWLVISIAGGVGDAVDAVARMRPGFVALAVLAATVRITLDGVKILSLARRTGPLTASTATGLALVVFGFGAVTPASPAEGLTIASRELQHRGHSSSSPQSSSPHSAARPYRPDARRAPNESRSSSAPSASANQSLPKRPLAPPQMGGTPTPWQ